MTKTLALFCAFASDHSNPGGFSWGLHLAGWKKTLDATVKPWLAWADEAGVEVQILAHNCFGVFDDDMRLDAYDACMAGDFDTITHNFASSWRPYTERYFSIAYHGDLDKHPWVEWSRVGGLIKRNLQPYVDAGFKRVCIDAAGEALNHPAEAPWDLDPNTKKPRMYPRSRNGIVLHRADRMFPHRTMIEATTHRYPMWEHLHGRDVVCEEDTWRRRHGLPGERSGSADIKGYGNPDYIKGQVYRIVDTLADAQRVVKEGYVPAVKPWKFAGKCKASEIFA